MSDRNAHEDADDLEDVPLDSDEMPPNGETSGIPEETEQEFAPLSNGKYLILAGPGAGSVVRTAPSGSELAETQAVPSRDEALDGGRPLLIVHRPYQGAATIPPLLAQLHSVSSGRMTLGVASAIPQSSPQKRRDWFAECPTASVQIADPCGYLLDPGLIRLDLNPIKDRARGYAPYFRSVGAPDWISQVLSAQRDCGANLLLTSGRALDGSEPQQSLDDLCTEGDDALAELLPDERLALNITVTSNWLSNAKLRDALIAQLIDQEQFDTWHIRVQWRNVRTHAQPLDAGLLEGYRELATVAEDEERKLLLPQAGLTGWDLLAFGATGFGAGISGSHNKFGEPTGGGGKAPRIERYFERKLLHTVERDAHDTLSKISDYVPCSCKYCAILNSGTSWNHDAAALHFMTNLGELTADAGGSVTRGGARGSIRRSVRRAIKYANGKPLAGPNSPTHLRAWDQFL